MPGLRLKLHEKQGRFAYNVAKFARDYIHETNPPQNVLVHEVQRPKTRRADIRGASESHFGCIIGLG